MKRFLLAIALCAACGGTAKNIPGTRVADTPDNRSILQFVEEYRLAVERRDAPRLAMMASRDYWEDSGTPTGSDDYGYEQLKDVLAGRFQQADGIRYSLPM